MNQKSYNEVHLKFSVYCMSLIFGAAALPAWGQSAPAAQPGQEPAWPQPFDVQGPLVQTFGFAVTQPGPIVVTVQAQGAPLSLSVEGPLPNPLPPMVQSGVGKLRINYTVTPQDLQRGMFWLFHVGLAQPFGGRANGSVTVQHPPVEQAKAMQAMQLLKANHHSPAPAAQAAAIAQARLQRDADFKTHVAQIAQRRAQNHSAILAQLQPMLDDMRRQKALLQQPGSPSPPGSDQIKSRAVTPYMQIKRLPPPPVIIGFTVAHEQDPIYLPPGSPQYGQPGDAVTISGTGFGNDDGELHFVIGPGTQQDLIAQPGNAVWLNASIFSPVPSVTGVLAYRGVIYIKRRSDGVKSNFVPFQFEPDLEQREIRIPADFILAQSGGYDAADRTINHGNDNLFSGITGVDQFFLTTKLKNGWTVAQQPIAYAVDGGGVLNDVFPSPGGQEFALPGAIGTDSLFMNVYFSVNPFESWIKYAILIPIQGPSGIPDGVVCTSIPGGSTCVLQ